METIWKRTPEHKKKLFVSFNFVNFANIFYEKIILFYFSFLFRSLFSCLHLIVGRCCVCAEKVFSFLSQDEVEKLKQEEEKKIETLKRDKKNAKILRATEGSSFDDGNDNVDGTSSEDDDDDDDDDDIHAGDSRSSR